MNADTHCSRIVIIGAGHAGGNFAAAVRQAGHTGDIVLIGDEPFLPYHRPPLSKAYLKGTAVADTLLLRPQSWYNDHRVDLRLGRSAVATDLSVKTVTLDDGTTLPYDILVLATGSRARRLEVPGAGLPGIHYLRDVRDADLIRAAIGEGRRLAIVGGGYIGLEVAASAISLGTQTVLIERESRILARVACEPLARFFDEYHRGKGLEIIVGAQVCAFDGSDAVTGVILDDGRMLECDAVLVGVGAEICDNLARDAGLDCEAGGVVVDDNGCTSNPAIYAIGDMTWRPMPLYDGRRFRLESVPNAVEQGRRAAASILAKAPPAYEVPWFWSDQYDLKLQIVGVPFDSHRLVVRGSVDAASFAIFHLTDAGRVLAVEAVNMPSEFIAGRTLVRERRIVEDARLADMSIPIKELVQAA